MKESIDLYVCQKAISIDMWGKHMEISLRELRSWSIWGSCQGQSESYLQWTAGIVILHFHLSLYLISLLTCFYVFTLKYW